MSYEPQGKVKPFIEAARAQPQRMWTAAEIAKMLEVQQSTVGSWVSHAMAVGVIHRGKRAGETVYSATPFPPEAAYPTVARRNAQEPSEITVPTFGKGAAAAAADAAGAEPKHARSQEANWFVPPRMVAPRAGSDAVHVNPPGRPTPQGGEICAGCSSQACWERGCVKRPNDGHVAAIRPAPTPAPVAAPTPAPQPPKPAPAAADASIPEDAGHEIEESVEPDAFISCRNGEIVLVGLEPDEEGRVTIPADLVDAIRLQLAGRPAC